MRDFRDAKAMAQTLREALKAKSILVTHSESLELVAKILGFHDWNVLSARIQSEHRPTVLEPAGLPPIAAGARFPTLPLRDIVLFPKMNVPLSIDREMSIRAVERAMAFDRRVLAVTQRRAADYYPSLQGLYRVGVAASIIEQTSFDDGTIRLVVKGLERAMIVQLSEGQFFTAEVAPVEESRGQEAAAFELSRALLEEFRTYLKAKIPAGANLPEWRYAALSRIHQPTELADAVAAFFPIGIDGRQDLLETGDVIYRLEKMVALIKAASQAG